jgi:hypothetical protein
LIWDAASPEVFKEHEQVIDKSIEPIPDLIPSYINEEVRSITRRMTLSWS